MAQRRHGVLLLPWAFKDVAFCVERSTNVSCLPGNANRVFHLFVIRLEILIGKRPVLDRRTGRDGGRSVAANALTSYLEVPFRQAPTLSPVVERCAADTIHHRVIRRPRQGGAVPAGARRRYFPIRLLDGMRPMPDV